MQFRDVVVDEAVATLGLVVVVLLLAGEAVRSLFLRVVVAKRHAEGNAVFAKEADQRIDRRLKAAARVHIAVLTAHIVAGEDEKRRTELGECRAKRLLDARVELAAGRLQMEIRQLQEAKLPVVSERKARSRQSVSAPRFRRDATAQRRERHRIANESSPVEHVLPSLILGLSSTSPGGEG